MNFVYCQDNRLPKLAWCAQLRKNDPAVMVTHGPWVETQSHFFMEGVWDGEFALGDFYASTACFGTGARVISDTQLVFSTPLHNAEKLYALRQQDVLTLSNSLVFLLTKTQSLLDPNYFLYHYDMDSMRFGIHDYVKTMPLQSGHQILIYMHRNIFIDQQLQVIEKLKPQDSPFLNYAHYRRYLSEKTAALHQNLLSPLRKITYQPLTTLSSGYDSPKTFNSRCPDHETHMGENNSNLPL